MHNRSSIDIFSYFKKRTLDINTSPLTYGLYACENVENVEPSFNKANPSIKPMFRPSYRERVVKVPAPQFVEVEIFSTLSGRLRSPIASVVSRTHNAPNDVIKPTFLRLGTITSCLKWSSRPERIRIYTRREIVYNIIRILYSQRLSGGKCVFSEPKCQSGMLDAVSTSENIGPS